VRRGKLLWISWTIQPGQRLTTRPERNLMYIEVTRYAELKERRMISRNASEGFYSPEICLFALGQGFLHPEASIAAHVNGECVSGVPGSQTIAGRSTVHSGTREGHVVPKFNGSQWNSGRPCRSQRSFQRVEEAKEEVWRCGTRTNP
jgi:hypothetical protein